MTPSESKPLFIFAAFARAGGKRVTTKDELIELMRKSPGKVCFTVVATYDTRYDISDTFRWEVLGDEIEPDTVLYLYGVSHYSGSWHAKIYPDGTVK